MRGLSIIGLLFIAALCACGPSHREVREAKQRAYLDSMSQGNSLDVRTVVHDGCEYIYVQGAPEPLLTHKADCANPDH
jgi:hypothetical protein